MRSAANDIWPHLAQPSEVEWTQPVASNLAKAMYPGPKIKRTNPNRDLLLKNLREHNAARLERARRR
jgi:hypothetical protein